MHARWKPPSPAGTIRTLGEFQTWFPTDADCLEYLEWLRWPAGDLYRRLRGRAVGRTRPRQEGSRQYCSGASAAKGHRSLPDRAAHDVGRFAEILSELLKPLAGLTAVIEVTASPVARPVPCALLALWIGRRRQPRGAGGTAAGAGASRAALGGKERSARHRSGRGRLRPAVADPGDVGGPALRRAADPAARRPPRSPGLRGGPAAVDRLRRRHAHCRASWI